LSPPSSVFFYNAYHSRRRAKQFGGGGGEEELAQILKQKNFQMKKVFPLLGFHQNLVPEYFNFPNLLQAEGQILSSGSPAPMMMLISDSVLVLTDFSKFAMLMI